MKNQVTIHEEHDDRRLPKALLSAVVLAFLAVLAILPGCVTCTALWDPKPAGTPPIRDVGTELSKSSLPKYYLEPPDIITVDAVHLVPRSPYILRVFDQVSIVVPDAPEENPINGIFTVEPGNTINLGPDYGRVTAAGVSVDDLPKVIANHLKYSPIEIKLIDPTVSVSLFSMGAIQQINGEHMIGPDGYITLGSYGRVYVSGHTVDEAREAIEFHLSKALEHPQIAVDVFSYNSKDYYVIYQSHTQGEQVVSFPYTGNETVLKAIANMNGLAPNSSKRIWVARPSTNTNKPVTLPVDWNAVTAYAMPQTNYHLLPGDRVYVVEDRFVATDGLMARWFAPIERVLGMSLLTSSTITGWQDVAAGRGTGAYW